MRHGLGSEKIPKEIVNVYSLEDLDSFVLFLISFYNLVMDPDIKTVTKITGFEFYFVFV